MNEESASKKYSREGLKWSKVARFLALPFRPSRLKIYLAVKRFEDIPIEKLLADGIQGVLLDADGTMGPHHTKVFPDSSVQMALKIARSGLKTAIYTNSSEDRFQQFQGIPVVSEAESKPEPRGFKQAMTNYLRLRDPHKVCMVGDNIITDGGAVDAGMRFIHVHPLNGNESFFLKAARHMAYCYARIYYPNAFDCDSQSDIR